MSSPVDLTPKFHKYKANIALISGISWDHINVFDNPEFYAKQFDLFIDSIVDGGVLIFNELDSLLSDIVKDNNSYIRKIEYNLPEHSVSNNNVFIKPVKEIFLCKSLVNITCLILKQQKKYVHY